MKLFNKDCTSQNLKEYFGDYNIAVGHREYMLESGKEENIHVCELNNGAGLRLEILKSRGLDIGRCFFKERPLSYRSYNGDCHGAYHENYDDGWLRSFAGGLLVTGGLTSMGAPIVDNDEILPLHGRISNIPSNNFHVENVCKDDEVYIIAKGSVRESKALKYNLLMERTITMKCGVNSFHIHDEVCNEGFIDQEHMMLYHFNIGYPLLDEGTKFYSNSLEVIPRDKVSKERIDPYHTYLKPTLQYPDVVYYHHLQQDEDRICHVALVNEHQELGIALSYRADTLDQFTQWKFTGKGNYVAGLEPCNARVNGRNLERKERRLKILKAQETFSYDIEVTILSSQEEIKKFLLEKKLSL